MKHRSHSNFDLVGHLISKPSLERIHLATNVFCVGSGAVVFACGHEVYQVTRSMATFTQVYVGVAPCQFY